MHPHSLSRPELQVAASAHRCQAIDLVKEDDGGLAAPGFRKQHAQLPLSFPHPLGQHVGSLCTLQVTMQAPDLGWHTLSVALTLL